jgi:hypothetical protein
MSSGLKLAWHDVEEPYSMPDAGLTHLQGCGRGGPAALLAPVTKSLTPGSGELRDSTADCCSPEIVPARVIREQVLPVETAKKS